MGFVEYWFCVVFWLLGFGVYGVVGFVFCGDIVWLCSVVGCFGVVGGYFFWLWGYDSF